MASIRVSAKDASSTAPGPRVEIEQEALQSFKRPKQSGTGVRSYSIKAASSSQVHGLTVVPFLKNVGDMVKALCCTCCLQLRAIQDLKALATQGPMFTILKKEKTGEGCQQARVTVSRTMSGMGFDMALRRNTWPG